MKPAVLTTHGRKTTLMDRAKSEPTLIAGALASIIVALAAHWNIVIDQASIGAILAPLATTILIRPHVTSVHK